MAAHPDRAGPASFEVLEPLRRRPERSGVFSDFDGTLCDLIADPSKSVPHPGVPDALAALGRRYGRVGVLSGRSLGFLETFFPPPVALFGLYGLERRVDGERADHPGSAAWRSAVTEVADLARASGPEGMGVEPKGLSLTLHYRAVPERVDEVRAWAQAQADRTGLDLRPARLSFELHPPVAVDKGSGLTELADGLDAVCFMGDDVGDLPAFDALDRLAAQGVTTVRIGVQGSEPVAEVLDRADLIVSDAAGALAVLQHLAVP